MPTVASITPADPSTAPTSVTNMIDGDVVNANALVLQASPPAPSDNPNLTLSFIWSYVLAACGGAIYFATAYVGAQYTIAVGTLLTFLKLVANTAARVDSSNIFQSSQTFESNVTFEEGVTFDEGCALDGGATLPAGQTLAATGQIALIASGSIAVTATGTTTVILSSGGTPHNLFDGQLVNVTGLGGVPNRQYVAHYLTTTTFSLIGVTGDGTYTSGTFTTTGQTTFATARAATRALSRMLASPTAISGSDCWGWTLEATGELVEFRTSGVLTDQSGSIIWEIGPDDVPSGSYIQSVGVCFTPGSHSGVPEDLPTVACYKRSVGAASASVTLAGATSTATPGSAGAYDVYTNLGVNLSATEQVDHDTWRYFVTFTSEIGTNSAAGMTVWGAQVNASLTTPVQG